MVRRRSSSHARSARGAVRTYGRCRVGTCRGWRRASASAARHRQASGQVAGYGSLQACKRRWPAAHVGASRRSRDPHLARRPRVGGHCVPQRLQLVKPAAAPPGPGPDTVHGFGAPRRPIRRAGHGGLAATRAQSPQPGAPTLHAGAGGRRQGQSDLPAIPPDPPDTPAPRVTAPASSRGVNGSDQAIRHVRAPQGTGPPGGVGLAPRGRDSPASTV